MSRTADASNAYIPSVFLLIQQSDRQADNL